MKKPVLLFLGSLLLSDPANSQIVVKEPLSIRQTYYKIDVNYINNSMTIEPERVPIRHMSLIFLVADYARAWQASHAQNACFRALGFGFSQTFRTFLSSFPLIIILLIFQALPAWVVIKLIAGYTPVTGGGVMLLLLFSQLLLILKIFLKALRYGSVTSLMEQNSVKVLDTKEDFMI